MMTLQDVLKAVDRLSPDELRAYLDQREGTPRPLDELNAEARARQLDAAFEQFREGLTQAELDEMTAAMSAKV